MSVADKLCRIRWKSFLSQTAFAKELGVNSCTVSRWESGDKVPNLEGMKAIKEFCEEHKLEYASLEGDWLEALEKGQTKIEN